MRASTRGKKKNTQDSDKAYEPQNDDEFDKFIERIENDFNNKQEHSLSKKRKQSLLEKNQTKILKTGNVPDSTSTKPYESIDYLSYYLLIRGNNQENLVKNKPTVQKTIKHWDAAESALLKIMMNGFSPIGRNVAGK